MSNSSEPNEEMRAEYEFSGGVRGKYYKQYTEGINVVLLEPDVAEVFRDSESVNQALHSSETPVLCEQIDGLMNFAKNQVPQIR